MQIAVLKGGRSLERQVSLRSASRVQDALERLGHHVMPVDVGPDLVDRLIETQPELAFVALHGRDGEDGTVQELLEALGIPYTGSGVSACIRAADKVLAKHAMRDRDIPTPDFFAFSETAFNDLGAAQALPALEQRLGFPIVVKPASQGSALGIKFARAAAELPGALLAAFSYDRKVLLERYVPGRDLAVSIIDIGDGPLVLPIVEAVPLQEEFYDFEARYEFGRTKFSCPARLPEAVTDDAIGIAHQGSATVTGVDEQRILVWRHNEGRVPALHIDQVQIQRLRRRLRDEKRAGGNQRDEQRDARCGQHRRLECFECNDPRNQRPRAIRHQSTKRFGIVPLPAVHIRRCSLIG